MTEIPWRPDWRVGIAWMDRDHAILRRLADRLFAAASGDTAPAQVLAVADELIRHARLHFHKEEREMDRLGHADEVQHRFQHDHLIHELEHLRAELAREPHPDPAPLASFLHHWLDDHILESDRPLAAALRADAHR
ncbi:bacteriohemerythrin [Inmirania thermothiophila]|uniref:Hemerythrin-like metal-binding protein n=1 Tax=Inmirania thermothiophila TaxID=1750597 RepID=A0A3N1Y8J9_9GAMM|nr:hemerythrin domain-containing protein [Inmirania thermothiophila]ROR35123.1 hemerythrin-like metal-binding protein [Inmirania thermothiophila]